MKGLTKREKEFPAFFSFLSFVNQKRPMEWNTLNFFSLSIIHNVNWSVINA